MDETLVCAYREANVPESLRSAAVQHAAGAFRLPSKVWQTDNPFAAGPWHLQPKTQSMTRRQALLC